MEYLTWDFNPVFFSIGSLKVYWYGLMFATAFIIGYQIMRWIYVREGRNVEDIDNLLIYVVIGTVVGARLGHCFFYEPSYYLSEPLKIFAIWEGGLASHGGAIGVLLGLYLYKRKTQETYLWLLDRVAIPAALAGGFIRIGNLFNSEILGIPTSVPWAIIFERIDLVPRHPAQIYEAVTYFLIFSLLLYIYKKGDGKSKDGVIFSTYLIFVFASRFGIEFVKAKQAAYSSEFWLSTGQMLSVPFVLLGVVLMFLAFKGINTAKA